MRVVVVSMHCLAASRFLSYTLGTGSDCLRRGEPQPQR
jgi:hypothetical protein